MAHYSLYVDSPPKSMVDDIHNKLLLVKIKINHHLRKNAILMMILNIYKDAHVFFYLILWPLISTHLVVLKENALPPYLDTLAKTHSEAINAEYIYLRNKSDSIL
ncbi:hypothetical protein ACJX0J_021061, partial [Zea mays]